MKKSTMTCLGVILFLTAAPASAMLTVDIGTPASEAPYCPVGWGPIEPTNSGGSYGGIATDAQSVDNLCRVIWDASDGNPSASLTFGVPIASVTIRHLRGLADDSFDVTVSGQPWGSIVDAASSSEVWATTTLHGVPGTTLTLTATGAQWSGFGTYGQVAIDRIEVQPIPAPGAILLGAIGAGIVAHLRRRRTL